jgi:hypothetical protein
MLDRGIVKFTAITKKNTVYERVCSNNPRLLAQMLGKDYIAKYESPKRRMGAVISIVDKCKSEGVPFTGRDLEKLLVKYDLLSVGASNLPAMSFYKPFIDDELTDALTKLYNDLSSNHRVMNDYVVYRNLYASDSKSFYGSVDINNLISVLHNEAINGEKKNDHYSMSKTYYYDSLVGNLGYNYIISETGTDSSNYFDPINEEDRSFMNLQFKFLLDGELIYL